MNFWGGFASLGRLLPGYIQGRQQAIEDNWQDLNNYNRVQAGQIDNAFDEAAFNARLSREMDLASNSQLGVYDNAMQTALNMYRHPSNLIDAQAQYFWQPAIPHRQYAGQAGYGDLSMLMHYANPYYPYM